jgi:DNA-binding ferritin-like protein (Dps family)
MEQCCSKFLGSLHYPEIQERQEKVSNVHEKTFMWIFDRNGVRHWDSFVDWLEKGEGIYWINGKAGSGKSTLMNYITTDSHTTDSLNMWAHSSQVLTPKFFFWNAGTDLQKSSLGLLRSLLYQILNRHQEVIPELIKSQDTVSFDDQMPIWTKKRLESSLRFVIDKISPRLCFFIDGLDEFDEGEEDMLELIGHLQNKSSVKICLSSRPLQCFINAFEHSAQLKLQNLTRRDIETYAEDRLHKDPRMEQLLQENPRRGKKLIGNVTDKAEGVFQWVKLAVKMLSKGLTNRDDWKTMEKRLNLLPKDIKSLYMQMWSRLGENQRLYREEAALFFRKILTSEISLLHFTIATNENLQSTLLDLGSTPPGTDHIISLCKEVRVHILTRCAGLLEVDSAEEDTLRRDKPDEDKPDEDKPDEDKPAEDKPDEDKPDEDKPDEDKSDEDIPDEGVPDEDATLAHFHKRTKVRFIHRTAHDFLVETKEGQVILAENPPPAFSPSGLLIKSELGLDRLLPRTSLLPLPGLLERVRECQIAGNHALESLMGIIESYFSSKYSDVSANSNWVENYIESEEYESPCKDFLGLAAAHGLCLDLSERFPQHIRRADPRLTNDLLSCALSCYPWHTRLELVLINAAVEWCGS